MSNFLTDEVNLWISATLWGLAALWCWLGATRGTAKHLVPRVVLAIGATGLFTTFLIPLIGGANWIVTASNMRRGWGWVAAIGIAWAAYTGIQSGRDMERATRQAAADLYREIEEARRLDDRE